KPLISALNQLDLKSLTTRSVDILEQLDQIPSLSSIEALSIDQTLHKAGLQQFQRFVLSARKLRKLEINFNLSNSTVHLPTVQTLTLQNNGSRIQLRVPELVRLTLNECEVRGRVDPFPMLEAPKLGELRIECTGGDSKLLTAYLESGKANNLTHFICAQAVQASSLMLLKQLRELDVDLLATSSEQLCNLLTSLSALERVTFREGMSRTETSPLSWNPVSIRSSKLRCLAVQGEMN